MGAVKALVGMGTWLLLIALCFLTPAASSATTELPPVLLKALLNQYQQSRDMLGNTHYLALVNYRQPSWEPRFYVIEPGAWRVVAVYRVAHGKGSDPDHDGFAEFFGDVEGSHMSSVGLYRTGDVYLSEQEAHGMSMRLEGLSETNSSAYERNIVIHANHYMEQDFMKTYGMPGRSHGCLVFSASDRDDIIARLKGGALIYAIR